ncbi:hypothetical protein IFO70_17175 [Phormidium tenue FACHB-886]|nr:hypothetical protein [Phormidium tenue FACHB-886]
MQKQLRLLLENLTLSAIAILVCAIAGFWVSFPINRIVNSEAAAFKASLGTTNEIKAIETSKLEDYSRTQGAVILLSAAVGMLSAQVVFLLGHQQERQ